MNDKAFNLAQKLAALAKGGVGGEKENAAEALRRHLKKYNIEPSDLETETLINLDIRLHEPDLFKYTQFVGQVVASVVGKDRAGENKIVVNKIASREKPGRFVRIRVTPAESVEIQAKIEFYWADYLEQQAIFYMAYIQTNQLYSNPAIDGTVNVTDTRNGNIVKLMDAIDAKSFRKQIDN